MRNQKINSPYQNKIILSVCLYNEIVIIDYWNFEIIVWLLFINSLPLTRTWVCLCCTAGEITTKGGLDYEDLSSLQYEVEVYVNDGYVDSLVQPLTLQVLNVNEQPTFQTSSWTVSKPDEGGVGSPNVPLPVLLLSK